MLDNYYPARFRGATHRANNGYLRIQSAERERAADLLRLAACCADSVLDVGARGGYFSRSMAGESRQVTALDLNLPVIDHPNVECVAGDVTKLQFSDRTFDLVLCAEVLEHIREEQLQTACDELFRVSRKYVLVGVPYRQDVRVGRTTCEVCGYINPPWGHVNSFDEQKLLRLFSCLTIVKKSFVGSSIAATNAVAAYLMDLAGNPYGTYHQEELCTSCGKHVGQPQDRNLIQKALTKLAFSMRHTTEIFTKQRPIWMHILFEKTR